MYVHFVDAAGCESPVASAEQVLDMQPPRLLATGPGEDHAEGDGLRERDEHGGEAAPRVAGSSAGGRGHGRGPTTYIVDERARGDAIQRRPVVSRLLDPHRAAAPAMWYAATMSPKRMRTGIGAAVHVLLLAACGGGDDAPRFAREVTVTGTCFAFAGGGAAVAGARVALAEHPSITTTSGDDGMYTLRVPDDRPFTPMVTHPDFVTMHLQTFTTAGTDLARVNFQMVERSVYDFFALALGTEPDPQRCHIASTVNTRDVRELDHAAFVAYGAHGVAGARVTTDPAVPDLVYFNERTIPDRTVTQTTLDGGVVAANVRPGVYRFNATHPTRRFDAFVATCAPGRLVNAGPPWGLREQ